MPAKSQAQRGYLNAHFGHDWVKRHDFDNKGKLPEHVERSGIPVWAHYQEATEPGKTCGTCDFYANGRCEMFEYTPVEADYVCNRWEGTIEKDNGPHALLDLLSSLEPAQKSETVGLALTVSKQVATRKKLVVKAQANSAVMNLRVHGMSRTPDGQLSYRMITRDNHYVGRTNPTTHRAKKGEVLTVEANHFAKDDNGNLRWINPNVVGHIADTPHSLKEIEALAGGTLAKDGADGPAGDIPPAADQGDSGNSLQANQVGALAATSGPTISDVHVNVPLKNISQAYVAGRRFRVKKADAHQQVLYGVVLEPNTVDSQDDYMLPNQVEKAAHLYLKKVARGKASVSKLQHRAQGFFKGKPGVVPVESFIAPVDFSYDGKEMIKKGTWVMALHIEDPGIWQDVLDGKYTGLSIGGTGIRQEMSVPPEGSEGYLSMPPASDWFSRSGSVRP